MLSNPSRSPKVQSKLRSQAMLEEAVSRQTDRVWAKDLWVELSTRSSKKMSMLGVLKQLGRRMFTSSN